MTRFVDSAAEFVRELARLAERLAALDLVVAQLQCDWSGFGSWRLDVQQGDAADRYGEALHQAFDSRQAAFAFVEDYLTRWVKER
jgi:hypothetical protein